MKSDNINEVMRASGFELRDMGNDCSAFQKTLGQLVRENGDTAAVFLLITNSGDLSAPDNLSDEATVGIYYTAGGLVEFATILKRKVTVSEALTFCDQMKQVEPL